MVRVTLPALRITWMGHASRAIAMNINELTLSAQSATENPALMLALLFAGVVLVLILLRNNIRHGWLNFKTRYRLNRLGLEQATNLQWPDGLGNYFTIDRLIMRPDGISLLSYKQYPGKIFCADNIDDWTQMVDKKSFRFENPLYELDYQVKILSSFIPDVPVNGYLFFDYQAEFPKGHPERVIHLDKIPQELKRDKKAEVEARVSSAWNNLAAMIKT